MRWLRARRRVLTLVCAGVVTGGICGSATILLIANATAQTVSASAVFDVTHVPPLLTTRAETPQLAYDVHCARAGVEDPEAGCRTQGSIFARRVGGGAYREIPLEPAVQGGARLVATLPDDLHRSQGFEYYAKIESPDVARQVTVPPGGAIAPAVSLRLAQPVTVSLGTHAFGESLRSGERVVFARWGDGPAEAGLEEGRNVAPIGASGFDVDPAGSVVILDHVHRRALRWASGARAPERVPLSINGTLADMAATDDGSLYVLETTSADVRAPLVRRFDRDGRELEAIEMAERGPAQIRVGPDAPVVLQRPSHQWMPVSVAGVPASPAAQRRRGRMGRPLRSGGEVVVFRHANELRAALVSRGVVTRSWRVMSRSPLGEVQLAEPLGTRLVLVVRVYEAGIDEFVVLVVDRAGLVSRTSLAPADWAEAAPLGRFRLVDQSLYRLGSTPAGVFVERYDLEVH